MDFDQLIADHVVTSTGDLIAAVEAQKLCASWQETEPDAYADWLMANGADLVAIRLTRIIRAARARRDPVEMVGRLRDAAEDGDVWSGVFRTRYAVDDENTQRLVGDMTGSDHAYVATRFAHRSRTAHLEAAFHRAVAGLVGTHRTADVIDEARYGELHARYLSGEAA